MKCFANCQNQAKCQLSIKSAAGDRLQVGSLAGKGRGIPSNPWRQFSKHRKKTPKKLIIIFLFFLTVCPRANRGVADRTSAGQAACRSLITLFSQPNPTNKKKKEEKSKENAGEKRKCRPSELGKRPRRVITI